MRTQVAARRYAEAAFLLAREEGAEDSWAEGLEALAALCADPQAEAFFSNTRVPLADKQRLLETALAGANPLVLNLGRLLIRRGKTGLAPQIATAYREILDKARGVSHALVTAAVPLTPDDVQAIEKRLAEITGGKVVVETEVDESILGGLIVRIGDRLIDGSTRSRLQELKRQLAGVAQ